MKNMSLSEMLTYSTVLIECSNKDHTVGKGTGFIIQLHTDLINRSCVPVIITNYHVIENCECFLLDIICCDDHGNPNDQEVVTITDKLDVWIRHPDFEVDLCCLDLRKILKKHNIPITSLFFFPLSQYYIHDNSFFEDFRAIEDIIMIGYPDGIADKYNHKPITRHGITATHIKYDYNGNKEFLIDLYCYCGSSGSPVFIFNEGQYTDGHHNVIMGDRVILAGILRGGQETLIQGKVKLDNNDSKFDSYTSIPINLGKVIKAEEILKFEQFLKEDE